MPDSKNSHPHEPAFHRPQNLWPLRPWIKWGYHGFFIPGHTSYQFFRFCIIGSIGVVVNTAVMYLTNELYAVQYILASVMAFLVASVNNFLLNKFFTFHDKDWVVSAVCKQYLKFVSVALISLGITIGVLAVLVELVGLHPVASNLIGVLAATVSNFLGNKFFAFKSRAS